jgi:hypothetical protein
VVLLTSSGFPDLLSFLVLRLVLAISQVILLRQSRALGPSSRCEYPLFLECCVTLFSDALYRSRRVYAAYSSARGWLLAFNGMSMLGCLFNGFRR